MTTPLIESLPELANLIGDLPPGDVPAAWWINTDPDVLQAYQDYTDDTKDWNDQYAELLRISALPPDTGFLSAAGRGELLSLNCPKGMATPPRWWRKDATGHLVPRRRTRAEKASPTNKLFADLLKIPKAVDYLTSIPSALTVEGSTYQVVVYRANPYSAICAFVGQPPTAHFLSDVEDSWQPMKISTYYMLRERQQIQKKVGR